MFSAYPKQQPITLQIRHDKTHLFDGRLDGLDFGTHKKRVSCGRNKALFHREVGWEFHTIQTLQIGLPGRKSGQQPQKYSISSEHCT